MASAGIVLPADFVIRQFVLKEPKETQMEMQMKLPKLYAFVRVASQIVAALGCITGLVTLYATLKLFRLSFMLGMAEAAMGVFFIVGSLVVLGLIYGFLAIVKAQVDIRNATVLSMHMTESPKNVQ